MPCDEVYAGVPMITQTLRLDSTLTLLHKHPLTKIPLFCFLESIMVVRTIIVPIFVHLVINSNVLVSSSLDFEPSMTKSNNLAQMFIQ